MTNNQQKPKTDWLNKGNRRFIVFVASVGIIAGSAFAVQAFAQSKTYSHLKLYTSTDVAEGGGGPLQTVGWRSHRRGGWSNLSDSEIESRITRVVKHAAIEIDATPEQQAQIIAILTPVALNMKSMRGEMRGTGMAFAELLTAQTVDRAAIEELRAEKLAEADEISRQWVNAVTDVSMVLTAEQRQTVEDRLEDLRSWRGHR